MKNVTGVLIKTTLALILVLSLGIGPLQASAIPPDSSGISSDAGGSSGEQPSTTPGAPSEQLGPLLPNPANPITPYAVTHQVKFYTAADLLTPLGGPILVDDGESVASVDIPTPPNLPGFRFTGWSQSLDNVIQDLDVYPLYVALNSYSITINYVFADNTLARQPVIYSAEEGSSFSRTVTSPTIAGYTADKPSVVINIPDVQADYVEKVTYTPATNTPYTVQHYQQKLTLVNTSNPHDPANYDLITTQNLTGTTGVLVSATAQSFTGFTAPAPLPSAQIAANGTTALKVYYDRNQYAVYFDSAGGSYVAPFAALYGAALTAPAAPTRAGYTFSGWTPALPSTMPANDLNLTATWATSGTVNYTLVYYLENIGSTGYDYVGTASRSATAGTVPTIPGTIPSGITFPIPSNRYTLNSTKTNAELPASVNGNGSTIVNVYYDRNSYTINFQFNAAKYTLTVAGTTYTTSPYALTAKFGASINLRWAGAPLLRSGSTSDGNFIGWQGSSTNYVTTQYFLDDNMISNTPLNASWDPNSKVISVVYNFRNLIGSGYTPNYGQSVAVANSTNSWNAKTFLGFTVQTTPVTITNNVATFNYDRNQYSITYYNGGLIDRTSTNYFQADISGSSFSQAPASRPTGIPSDYTFAGWYTSPQGYDNTKFNFTGATMPSNNLILYARWDKPSYTAIFNPDNGSPTFAQTVVALTTLTQPTAPTKPGFVFSGWYLPSSTLKYTFSFPVTSSLNLTAHWIPTNNISYDVIYQKQGVEFQRQTFSGRSVGDSVTAQAIVVPGFLPDALSKSLTLAATGNQIIFNYTPFSSVGYTVKYQDSQGSTLLPDKTASSTQASVTENYINIAGYYPNFYQQTLILGPNASANVITFIYTKNADVNYIVRSLFENLDGSYSSSDVAKTAPAGSRVDELPQTVTGFTFEPGLSVNNRIIASDGSTIIRMVYNRVKFDITFAATGQGSLTGTTAFNVKYGSLYGTAVTTPTPVANPGYMFTGWTPTVPAAGTVITASASYTAAFEKDPTQWVTVTFDKNSVDATGTMNPSAEMLIGSSYTLPSNAYDRANYSFVNWDTNPAGDGYSYTDAQTITVNANTTLYAQWVEDTRYLVVYLGNGGVGTQTDTNVYYDSNTVTLQANSFVNPGYTFVNWQDQDGAFFNPLDTFSIHKNTYLSAQWVYDANQWTTIVYDKNNAGATGTMASQTVLTGQPHTLLTNAYSLEHYVFTGWATNPDGTGTTYADAASITPSASGTLNLYAQWREIPHVTITYLANNGTSDTTSTSDYLGSTATILPANTFTYEHYDFRRWSTNPDGTGTSYFPGSTLTLASDITLYAFWTPRALYDITYQDGFSGDSFVDSEYADEAGDLDLTVDPNPFVRTGYAFNRWQSADLGTAYPGNVIYDIHSNETFVAQWDALVYAITYDLDGGTVSGSNPTSYTIETPTFDIINPTRPGYIFTGWTGTDLSGTTTALAISQGRWGDLAFTANWTRDDAQWATITFEGNNSDAGSMAPITDILIGTDVTLPANAFTRTDYGFVNWDTDPAGIGTSYIDSATITVAGNMTLFAQWVPDNYYVVVYLGNGGTGTLTDSAVYPNNDPVSVLDNTGPTAFVYPGYNFVDWEDQDGTHWDPAETFNIQENTFLSAQWEFDADQWTTIIYDPNSLDSTGTMTDETVLTGVAHTLATNAYSRDFYSFLGWNTEPDGAGTFYANGETITPDTSGDLTLYAQWTEAFYTVTYLDGFSSGSFTETSILTGGQLDVVVAQNPFTRTGFAFDYWLSSTSVIAYPLELIADIQGNLTFTAQWSAVDYPISYDLDGGTGSSINPDSYTVVTPSFTLTNPTKPGYTFAGWTGTGLDSQVATVTVGEGTTGALSYTAHWVKDPSQWSTITFVNSDGAKGAFQGTLVYEGVKGAPIATTGDAPVLVLFALDQSPTTSVNYPAVIPLSGYAFAGWDQAVPSVFPESNLLITGYWKASDGASIAATGDTWPSLIAVAAGIAALAVLALGVALRLRKRSKNNS